MYMPIRSHISLLWDKSTKNIQSYFALEFGKIAESDFVYTLASTNINQSAPNLVKMYSITCIQRPLKGSDESGLLQQVVFKCRF